MTLFTFFPFGEFNALNRWTSYAIACHCMHFKGRKCSICCCCLCQGHYSMKRLAANNLNWKAGILMKAEIESSMQWLWIGASLRFFFFSHFPLIFGFDLEHRIALEVWWVEQLEYLLLFFVPHSNLVDSNSIEVMLRLRKKRLHYI